jgi:dihydropteroate synthase
MTIGKLRLPCDRPRVMGVLNVTPDSFSDGGKLFRGGRLDRDMAVRRALHMAADGASIIDIGGESTRPGAAVVAVTEELDRVVPVVEKLRSELADDVLVSVDTSTPEVMREAAKAGVAMINDVRALQRDGALAAARETGLPVCLMHMQGTPATMQLAPSYKDVVTEVTAWLLERVDACLAAGIARDQVILDPGIGFGKSDAHNLRLLNHLPELAAKGYPVLVGVSRKSMIGRLLGRDVNERLAGSLALTLLSAQMGASILRVHDVRETVDVLRMMQLVASG